MFSNLVNAVVRARPRCLRSDKKYAAPFSSISDRNNKVDSIYGESDHHDNTTKGAENRVHATSDPRKNDNEMSTEDVANTAKDTAGLVADMAKVGVVGAMETGLKLGEMAKLTLDGMWDVTKNTVEGVRDTMVNDDDNSGDDNRRSRQVSNDKHVEDLRRKARGYDLKD